MRICVLGGATVPVCNLTRHLVQLGNEVHLVAGYYEQDPPSGVIVHDLKVRHKLDLLLAARTVRGWIDRIEPDVLHAFYLTSYGYLASLIPGKPVVATAMGTDVFGAPELSKLLAGVRIHFARRAIRCADHLHSVSPAMTDRLIELGASPARISTFPRGISLDRFGLSSRRPSGKAVRMVCNRKLEPVYDYPTLLRATAIAVSRGADCRLDIIGRGASRGRLEALTAELSLSDLVTFHGDIPHEQMPAALSQSDVFVSASLSDGMSSSLLEAMASGCVPVVSDIAANRPWVREGENGFLFEPGDPDSLARGLERAIHNRSRWEAIAIENRGMVAEKASLERGCERIESIYRELTR